MHGDWSLLIMRQRLANILSASWGLVLTTGKLGWSDQSVSEFVTVSAKCCLWKGEGRPFSWKKNLCWRVFREMRAHWSLSSWWFPGAREWPAFTWSSDFTTRVKGEEFVSVYKTHKDLSLLPSSSPDLIGTNYNACLTCFSYLPLWLPQHRVVKKQ